MAQHDYVIANASGASVRADINSMALAISSNNSGSSEPSTKYAYEFWIDSGNGLIKIRNGANNAWITLPLSITANNTVDINGGAIDGTNIGASSAGTGAFTTLNASGTLTVGGDIDLAGGIDVDGTSNLDIVDIDGAVDMASTLSVKDNTTISAADGVSDNTQVLVVENLEATDGRNYGLKIKAGSTANDAPLFIQDHDAANDLMIVRGNGAVGIGTTAPARSLHVNSADANIASFEGHQGEGVVISSSTNGQVDIIGYDDTAGGYNDLIIRASSGVGLRFATSGVITANGVNLGKSFGTNSFMIGDSTTGTINSANQNVGIGIDVFESLTIADDNTAIGTYAMKKMISGSQNVAVGLYALQNDTDASFNVAVGYEAMNVATNPGNSNTAVGSYALGGGALTTSNNTAVGRGALQLLTSGAQNIGIGVEALKVSTG